MTREEIMETQDDLIQMKNSIRKLEEKLSHCGVVEEIYDVARTRRTNERNDVTGNEEISAGFQVIKELDALLKTKTEEMKIAKLERIREIEESHQLIAELSNAKTPGAVKNNSEQFMKLLKTEADEHSAEKEGKPVQRLKLAKSEEKKLGSFVERNIQLAKCGDGVLSLTDEEKMRLKLVLKDMELSEKDSATDDERVKLLKNKYAIDDELKKSLEEIDRKLEEHDKMKFSLCSVRHLQSSLSELRTEIVKNENTDLERSKGKIKGKRKIGFGLELKRLKEVDKMLRTLKSATEEEISPLQEEDLQFLIEESRQSLSVCGSEEDLKQGELEARVSTEFLPETPSKEIIVELVSAAKLSMPNFKFRYKY